MYSNCNQDSIFSIVVFDTAGTGREVIQSDNSQMLCSASNSIYSNANDSKEAHRGK